MAADDHAAPLRFDATPRTVEGTTILRLPDAASRTLPSRGQVAVEGSVNGRAFRAVLEPDGAGGHWMKLDRTLQRAAGVRPGEAATLAIRPSADWPEPAVPDDLQAALAAAPQKIRDVWEDITPMARWEWVRWVNATRNPQTRRRRVEVSISKIDHGKRRPCCFNLAACTDPDLSRNGRLVELGATR